MKKILKVLLIGGLALWGYFESASLALGANLSISSASDQTFISEEAPKDAQAITITDVSGSGIIVSSGLRILIPDSFGMQWHGAMLRDDSVTDTSNADFSVIAAQIISAGVTLESSDAGATGSVEVNFTSINSIPADAKIVITFPDNFVFNSKSPTLASSATMSGDFSVSITGQVITVTRNSTSASSAGSHLITLTNIKNPIRPGTTGAYSLKIQTLAGFDIDVNNDLAASTIVPAATSRITLNSPDDMTAGAARAAYTLTRYDEYGNLSTQEEEVFDISTTSTGDNAVFYNDATASEAGNIITSITIPQGSSSVNFWYDDTKMGAYTIAAIKSDQPEITVSDGINVKHAEPDHLRFVSDIPTADAKQVSVQFNLPQLAAVDRYDNILTNDYGAAAYSGNKAITYSLSGQRDAPDGNGTDLFYSDNVASAKVNFTNGLSTNALSAKLYRAQNTVISPADSNLPSESLPSNEIIVNPATATKLVFKQQPSGSAIVNSAFLQQPVVAIQDHYGNQTLDIFPIKLYDSIRSEFPYADAPGILTSDHEDNTLNAVAGEASFSGVEYNASGVIYLYAQGLGAGSNVNPVFSNEITLATSVTTMVKAADTPVADFNLTPTNDTLEKKFKVLKFKVTDAGEDKTPTLIDQIKIAVSGTGGHASTDIAWAGLYVGEEKVADAASITDDFITFGQEPNSDSTAGIYSVPDSSSVEFTVYIHMKPDKLSALDGQSYIFTTDEDRVGVDRGASSQMTASSGSIAAVTGTIKVDMTHLEIVTEEGASTLTVSAGVPVELLVRATDANKNIDSDYNGSHTLVFSGLNSVGTLYPKIESVLFGYNITISFSGGISASQGVTLTPYKSEEGIIVVQESGKSYSQHGLTATIVPAATSRITLNSPDDMTAGAARAAYTLTRYDEYGNLSTQEEEVFDISTTSTGDNAVFYNDATASEAGNIITSITIPQGSSSVNFWYDDTKMGAYTIAAIKSDQPEITVSDGINVKHAEPDHLRFVSDIPTADAKQVSVQFNLPQLAAVDRYDNILTNDYGAAAYSGNKAITYSLSGQRDAPDGNGTDLFYSDNVASAKVNFTNGLSTNALSAKLYRAQNTVISPADSNLPSESLPSNEIIVNPATATKLVFKQQPSGSAIVNSAFLQQPVVAIQDHYGNQTLDIFPIKLYDSIRSEFPYADAPGILTSDHEDNTLNAVAGEASFSGVEYNASGVIYLYAQGLGAGSNVNPVFSNEITLATSVTTMVKAADTPVADFNLTPTNDTLEKKFKVLKFKVTDAGEDKTPTLIDQIKIAVSGTGGHASTDIAWAGLYVGEEKVADAASITDDFITFGQEPNSDSTAGIYSVPDSSSVEFTVYIHMKPDKLSALDGQSYIFTTDEDRVGVDRGASSQMTASSGSIAAVTGTIKVDMTHLEIVTEEGASTLTVSAGVPVELLVRATDANKNIDSDYNGSHTLVFSGLNSVGTLYPKIESVLFGYNITISFSGGISASQGVTLTPYKSEEGIIVVQESGKSYSQHGLTATINAGAASNIALLSGNNQSGKIAAPLLQAFVVAVTDVYGNGIGSGTGVDFAILSQPEGATGALLSTISGVTDANGHAFTTLTVGSLAGDYQVTASSAGLSGSPVTFIATGLLPSAIQLLSGDNQSKQVVSALDDPLVVKIVDSTGIPIPREKVDFTISSYPEGAVGQALLSGSVVTDDNGQAQTSFTLGDKAGVYKVTVNCGSLTAVDFNFNATARAPYQVALRGPVSVKAGEVSTKFTVSIEDEYNNPSNLSQATVFSLTNNPSRPSGIFYSNSDGTLAINSLTVAKGTNSASFYYKDTITGMANITATRTSGQSLIQGISSQEVTVIPSDAYRFTIVGNTDTIETGESKVLTITAYDNLGNVKSDYTGNVNVLFSGASASPAPSSKKATASNHLSQDIEFGKTTSLNFINGVAVSTLKFYKVEDVNIKITSGSIVTAEEDSLSFTVRHGQADHLKFGGNLPALQEAGVEFDFETTLQAVDLYDNICNGLNGSSGFSGSKKVTWSLSGASDGPEGNVIDEFVSPVEFSLGVSTTTLSAKLYRAQDTTITAAISALIGVNVASNTITVEPGAVAKLRFSQEPAASSITSQALEVQPKVAVSDQYGNPVSTTSANVSIAASTSNDSFVPVVNGVLSAIGGLTASTVNGVASFSGVTYNYPETIYLRATVAGVSLVPVFSSGITFSTAQETALSVTTPGPTAISSLAYTTADRVGVLNFRVVDGGTDGFSSKIRQVIVKRNTSDTTGGWTNYLQGVYITDGATQVVGRIEDDQIIFGLGGNDIYDVTNGTTKNFTVSVFLKNPLPLDSDNKVLGFKLDPATDIVFGSPSSRLVSSSVMSSTPKISVVATDFAIFGSPTMNAGDTQPITLKAVDILGNIDKDYVGEKTLVFSGPSITSKGNEPIETTSNIPFGTDTPVSFTNGQSSSTVGIKLFKAETAYVKAADISAGITTPNQKALIVTVYGGAATGLSWLTQPVGVVVENAPWKEFSISVTDAYGNTSSSSTEVTVAPSNGSISTGSQATVTAQSGIATFYNFAVNGLNDEEKITLSASASGVAGTGPSNEVQVFKVYKVTVFVKDYTSASNLTECALDATSNGVVVDGFPKTGNSPFTFNLPYGTYTFRVSKEKYVDENTEKTAGVAADYLDGVYDAKITWSLTATSLVEATADYKAQSAFVYDESTDKLSIRVWLEKRGKMVVNDDVNILGNAVVDIYNDSTGGWLKSITLEPPAASNTVNGVYFKEIPNVVSVDDDFNLVAGKTYFARVVINYGGLTGTGRSYEGGATFSVTINENLRAVTNSIQTVATNIAGQTAAIQKTIKDEIEGQITSVVVPKITDVKTETSKILSATGTESLQDKIAEVKTQVVQEVQPHIKSGILNGETAVRTGSKLAVRYRTDSGLSPTISVYSPKNNLLISDRAMAEIGITGIYEYNVTFLPAWGRGSFTIVCSEPVKGTADAFVLKVSDSDIEDISSSVSAVLGSTSGITNLKKVTETLNAQFSDMDKAIAQISKNITGKVEEVKGAAVELAGVFKQLEDMSNTIKSLGGTAGINIDKIYEVSKDKQEDISYIKNKSEELKAAMELNQKMIENVAKKPVVQTWFEFK